MGNLTNKLRKSIERAVKSGNSAGAVKGWETRRRGGDAAQAAQDAEVKAPQKYPEDWHSKRRPGLGDDITHHRETGEPIVQVVGGKKNYTWGGGWHRQDRVKYGGKLLEGGIQVKKRPGKGGRIEASTFHESGAVIGSDPKWLAESNRLKEAGQAKPWHK